MDTHVANLAVGAIEPGNTHATLLVAKKGVLQMTITGEFILPADVLVMPVADLPESVREKVDYKEGDFAITRPHVRTPSKIVDEQGAALLKEFQTAKTIVEAILSYSESRQAEPQETLEESLPLLKNFIDARLLVHPGSVEAESILPTLSVGDTIDEFEIRQPIQILEDTELYQVRCTSADQGDAALKILRDGNRPDLHSAIERESVVLKHLDGKVNPRLIKVDVYEGRPYLTIEWFYGVPVPVLANELRQLAENAADAMEATEARARLQKLVVSLLVNYAHVHEQGVIHSDVHPNNLLVNDADEIMILDFGLARFIDESHPLSRAPRGGVGFYYEPEVVLAGMTGKQEPQSSLPGEQYAVAAVAYQLFTGATHINFSLQHQEMLRQIVEEETLPFSSQGVTPWPEVEQALAQALNKDPQRRFASMRDFAETIRRSSPPASSAVKIASDESSDVRKSVAPGVWVSKEALLNRPDEVSETFIQNVLQLLQPDGELFRSEIGEGHLLPTCSANYGTAGIAYGLLRLACDRDDPQLLALADLWITKTLSQSHKERAFYNDKLEITKENVSDVSMHHMVNGVYFVRALVSHALGDAHIEQAAIEGFIATSQAETDNLDITLGRSSVLHGCTLLAENAGNSRFLDLTPLLQFGDDVMQNIWEKINLFGPVAEATELSYLGMAHGWAGLLYATLRWCQSKSVRTGAKIPELLPDRLEHRLKELAQCGLAAGRGVIWPWQNQQAGESSGENGFMPGWCNGSAGHVYLWTLAHKLFGQPSYLDMARKAAWGVWEQPCSFNNLCCGATGCAYAQLNFYQHTGEKDWLARARQFGLRAATTEEPPSENETDINSLYKGKIGTMVLLNDLAHPATARMPLFE